MAHVVSDAVAESIRLAVGLPDDWKVMADTVVNDSYRFAVVSPDESQVFAVTLTRSAVVASGARPALEAAIADLRDRLIAAGVVLPPAIVGPGVLPVGAWVRTADVLGDTLTGFVGARVPGATGVVLGARTVPYLTIDIEVSADTCEVTSEETRQVTLYRVGVDGRGMGWYRSEELARI